MATLRAFFHMGRVECVTCQVPRNQSIGGGLKVVVLEVALDVVGARRVIGEWPLAVMGSSSDMLLSGR